MADQHVVSQLRAKQAELQATVAYFEGKLTEARANLTEGRGPPALPGRQ